MWHALGERLSEWNAEWQSLVGTSEEIPPITSATFEQMSDTFIFEAFATAAISGNARWDRISAVQAELAGPFQGFSPRRFAALSDQEIDEGIVPWFRQRRAGSARLPSVLRLLRQSAEMLQPNYEGDARTFLKAAYEQAGGSPEEWPFYWAPIRTLRCPVSGLRLPRRPFDCWDGTYVSRTDTSCVRSHLAVCDLQDLAGRPFRGTAGPHA